MPPDLFDSVESLSASFLQRRSRLIAAGCALVVVTAVTTAALSFNGADSATRSFTASGAANGATPLPPNSSRVSSVVDPGIPVFLPSYVPAGFEFSSFVTHTAATDTSDLPNEPSTEVTLLNSDGTSLVRFSAIDGGQPNPDIPADREARRVRIGDREGTLIIDSPSALRLVWEYREPGFSMTGEAVGLRADDFIAVAASVVPSRDGNGRPRIQLSRLPAGWYVVDVDADPVDPRWVAVYQRWTTAVGEYVSVTGEAPLSETQIVAKYSLSFGVMPVRKIQPGRIEYWFASRNQLVDGSVKFANSAGGVVWVDGKQTVVVYSTIAARELETVVHSMAHVSLPELDALVAASRPVSNAVTSESRGFFYPLSGPDFPAAPSVHIVQDNPDSLFSCVTLDPRGDRHETCSQSDAIVAVYGQIVSSAGSVRIGGLVNSTVAAIRVVPDVGKPVPVPFVADQRMTNGRQLFYGELQRGIRGDVVEFIGPDGDVVARRYWRAPSFKVSDASYVVPTGGSTATEFDGVRVSATDRRFVDGSFSECNGIEFTSTKGLVLVGSLGCSEVPVDDTAAIPEGFSIASSGYRFTAAIVPTDAVTAELVFATQRIKPLTILKTNRQRLVVDRRSPTDEAPLEIRYLGRDGRIVATIGFWYDQSSVPSSK